MNWIVGIDRLEAKLSDFRNSSFFTDQTDVIHIVDDRKKKEIGFFIPASLKDSFSIYRQQEETRKKLSLLKKIALAQKADPIDDDSVGNGIE
jgi:hypothetical protein